MIFAVNTLDDAVAIPYPKYIWVDIDRIVVYTGADIPNIPAVNTISVEAFRDRFTTDEMDAVIALTYAGDAIARRLILQLQTATEIVLDSPKVVGGMGYLLSKGVVTQIRHDEILRVAA